MFVVRQGRQTGRRWHLDNAAETIIARRSPRPAAEVVPLTADGGGGSALRRRHAVIGDATCIDADNYTVIISGVTRGADRPE